jgi:hypothetical protein
MGICEHMRGAPERRLGFRWHHHDEFVFGLNLFGVVSALIAARVEGIAGGSILAFASAAIVAVWLLLPSTSEAPPGNA